MKSRILALVVVAVCLQGGAQSIPKKKDWYKARANAAGAVSTKSPSDVDKTTLGVNAICLLDSDYTKSFGSGWSNLNRRVYQYDNKSNCITQIHAYKSGNAWTTTLRHKRSFDAANNMTADVTEFYTSPTTWSPSQRMVYTYTLANKPLSLSNDFWDTQQSSWKTNATTEWTYDQNNHVASTVETQLNPTSNTITSGYRYTYTNTPTGEVKEEIDQYWNLNQASWQNDARIRFDYDIFGNAITGTLQTWNGNAWSPDARAFFTYNGKSQFTSILVDTWNSQTNQWVKDYKETYSYNSSNDLTNWLSQYWDSQLNVWENDSRSFFTYDGNHHELTWDMEQWTQNTWKPALSTISQYDNYGNQVYNHQTSCIGPTYTCQPMFESNSYYNCTTVGRNEPSAEYASLHLYPNPVSDILHVYPSGTRITVADLTGKVVLTQPTGSEINVSHLPKGLYLLRATVEGTPTSVVKLVKD